MVTGSPAAGKSTLAPRLAAVLGYPLVAKDRIKETLHDSLGIATGDREWGVRLGSASFDLAWHLVGQCPTAVLEANLRPGRREHHDRLDALGGAVVEVHCWCPPEVALARFAARAGSPDRHAAHGYAPAMTADDLRTHYAGPVAHGPVITVDTTRPIALDALVGAVRGAFAEAERR